MDKFGCFVHHALQSFEQLSFQNQQQAIVYPYQPMEQQQASKLVFPDPQTGHLMYQEYNDGDKIIDFSSVGFLEGRSAIPTSNGLLNLPTIIVYPKMQGTDQTDEIQQAIDTVGGYPARKDGLRGVVHFARGTYRLKSCLHIQTSGIILQGAKDGDTVFENKGEMNTLIKVRGGANVLAKKRAPITDATVPVGSQEIHVKHAVKRYNVGDLVVVAVQFNATWVKDIGMDVIHPKGDTSKNNGWRPGRLEHLRTITAIWRRLRGIVHFASGEPYWDRKLAVCG
ncbi:hypothetical protein DM01DRAFT_1340694 [Hesseltinella vesiculosa]|uniref:Pectate lyase superfamily protein domain-containing protein n=1 Tax=Hesseltinella vesiculosa TaxID=101127 RepID=A0A1X2G372_9FUNG|nr:hypothetical protein DM01DRAFT_1340694 [Hesseltinella vesiculosa]